MATKSNLRLVSFDGDGIQGLSQLTIMDNIMHRLIWDRQPTDLKLPCEHFDLMGGSGTGGLIAIMFAKLRMTVEEAHEEFETIAEEVYRDVDITPKERSQRLRKCMENIMNKKDFPLNMKLFDEKQTEGTACFVVTIPGINVGTKMCLRSYPVPTHPASAVTVIEAVLATCAAQPAFAPATSGVGSKRKQYIGPGFGASNPTHQVITEAHSRFGVDSTVSSLLSIGNGDPGIIESPSDGNELGFYKVVRDVMEDCSKTAEQTEQKIGRAGIYSRFSVEQGMQKAYASRAMDPSWIVTQTESYLLRKVDQLATFVSNHQNALRFVTLGQLRSGDIPALSAPLSTDQGIPDTKQEKLLSILKPDLKCGLRVEECMDGTRGDVLERIRDWIAAPDAPNILWLKGHPGIGKSAIASSVVEKLRESKRLGSSFFFRREQAEAMTPNVLWRTVAYDLARRYPTIRKRIIAALEADEDLPTIPNIDQLFRQLIRAPLMASDEIPAERSPVVVIDALDECGVADGQYPLHRRNLIQTLKSWSELPKTWKLIVTSRREKDIDTLFSTTHHEPLEVIATDSESLQDVRRFFESHFRDLVARYEGTLPADWPGHENTEALNKSAGGLFIWAKTAAELLNRGQAQKQLNRILGGAGTGGLSKLYSWILNASFSEVGDDVLKSFHSIVGTIILAKNPLSAASLVQLCSTDPATIHYICTRLHSVMEPGDILKFRHKSFYDFLLDQAECPPIFLVDLKQQNQRLALACLQTMNRGLRFNICDLKSSYDRNSEVKDLVMRIKKHVPTCLFYSCCFWASHLAQTTFTVALLEQVQNFMYNQFLFWLEVLSLSGRVNTGSEMVQSLINWLRASQQDDAMATDLKRFIASSGSVMSQSAPHIYLSALPFSPRNSVISKEYLGRYPQRMKIENGGQNDWPALQNVLTGHTSTVNSVAFSPDGSRVVSGSSDNTIRVWDAQTGNQIAEPFQGHTDWVRSVAFSPDGSRVVSGSSDNTIRVWDAQTGNRIAEPFQGHTNSVNSVAFSPDGSRVVSGSGNNTIRVWDAQTGKQIAEPFQGHTSYVTSVAFSPDGSLVVSGSSDNTIRVWDAQTGKQIAEPFQGHTSYVTSVAFSPDGSRVVSGSFDNTIRVWDAQTGKQIAEPFQGHTSYVTSVAFSPDGSRVVSGSDDNTIRVWDAQTGNQIAEPFQGHTHWVRSVAFSPDGSRVVSGSFDNTIRVWDAQTGKQIAEPFQGHTSYVTSVAFSPDGSRVVSGSNDNTIRVWDAQTGKQIAEPFQGHTSYVTSVAFSPDGSRVVSGSFDNTIRVWDAQTGNQIAEPFQGHTSIVTSVAFSPDGSRVVSGSEDNTIRVWDAQTGNQIAEPFQGHTNSVWSVAFSPDGSRVVSGSLDNTIRVWDAQTGKQIAEPFQGHTHWVRSVAFSPDGSRVVSGSWDNTIRVWDAQTGKQISEPFQGHTHWVRSVAFSPDGSRVVSGSRDNTIRVWDAQTGNQISESLERHADSLTSLAFSSDGSRIVSASDDSIIQISDTKTGQRIGEMFKGHTGSVNSVAFSSDGSRVVSGSRDKTIRVWDTKASQNSPEIPSS